MEKSIFHFDIRLDNKGFFKHTIDFNVPSSSGVKKLNSSQKEYVEAKLVSIFDFKEDLDYQEYLANIFVELSLLNRRTIKQTTVFEYVYVSSNLNCIRIIVGFNFEEFKEYNGFESSLDLNLNSEYNTGDVLKLSNKEMNRIGLKENENIFYLSCKKNSFINGGMSFGMKVDADNKLIFPQVVGNNLDIDMLIPISSFYARETTLFKHTPLNCTTLTLKVRRNFSEAFYEVSSSKRHFEPCYLREIKNMAINNDSEKILNMKFVLSMLRSLSSEIDRLVFVEKMHNAWEIELLNEDDYYGLKIHGSEDAIMQIFHDYSEHEDTCSENKFCGFMAGDTVGLIGVNGKDFIVGETNGETIYLIGKEFSQNNLQFVPVNKSLLEVLVRFHKNY